MMYRATPTHTRKTTPKENDAHMRPLINIQRLHAPLMAAGLVPPNCRLWEISVGVEGALAIRYEVFLTAEQLVDLGVVFQDVGGAILAAPDQRKASDQPGQHQTPSGA